MGVKNGISEKSNLFDVGLQINVESTVFEAESHKELLQDSHAIIIGRTMNRPKYAGLPPILGIPCCPGNTIVIAAGGTGNPMISLCKTRKRLVGHHGLNNPLLVPQVIQAWAMTETLPAASWGSGFSSVIASTAQNH